MIILVNMAEEAVGKQVSLDAITVSAPVDCLTPECDNKHIISSAEFSPEELYKHALQFYKGRNMTVQMTSTAGITGSDYWGAEFTKYVWFWKVLTK